MNEHGDIYLENGWEVIVARSPQDIEVLRPIWEQIQAKEPYPNVTADIDRFVSVIESRNGQAQPYVICFKQNELPRAMVIAQKEKFTIRLKLGYKSLFRPTLEQLSVVYGGIIGQPDDDLCRLIVSELIRILKKEGLDAIYFDRLKTDSSIYKFARKVPGFLCRCYLPDKEEHWTMTVPRDIELFYGKLSKKHRGNIRRYIRRLETDEFTNGVKIIYCDGQKRLDEIIKAVHKVSLTTYQYGLGCGFEDDSATHNLLAAAGRQGWLRMAVLYIWGQPAAFQIGLVYRGTYFLQQIGYDPKWSKFNIGTVLFVKVLEGLCSEPNVERIDFGFGGADYKTSYGDTKWEESSFLIFALRPYPIIINILYTITVAVNRCLKAIFYRAGALNWIKRRWRNLLQKKEKNSEGEK